MFDPYTGYLNFFKSKAPTATACGHVDMAACRSIETTDPELKRFVLNLPSRQVTLMSSGPEETIYWMEELLERKSVLAQRVDDESKDEDLNDWEVVSADVAQLRASTIAPGAHALSSEGCDGARGVHTLVAYLPKTTRLMLRDEKCGQHVVWCFVV